MAAAAPTPASGKKRISYYYDEEIGNFYCAKTTHNASSVRGPCCLFICAPFV